MKISSMFHTSVFFMTLLFFSMPFAGLDQQVSVQTAAEEDAQATLIRVSGSSSINESIGKSIYYSIA